MSHKMFICKFCWRKKRKKRKRAAVEWSRGNSKPASLYHEREREREGDHRGHGVTLETSNTLRQIQFLCADTLLIQR